LRRFFGRIDAMNRLVLFDIDGTLIKSGSRSHKLAFASAFTKIYGIDTAIDVIDHDGKSDKRIIVEVLKKNGLNEESIRVKIDEAMREMADFFEKNISIDEPVLLEGVEELLKELKKNNILIGLITGNLEPIARAKLKRIKLNKYFKFGGFGNDSEKRSSLIKIAIKRAEDDFNFKYDNNVFVIGDTPKDVKAGREAGVKVIIVPTGKYSEKELKAQNPDFLFKNLTCKEEILKAVLS
jgi:phosphoglycolate phosphatase